jgi:hypothetical protein
MQGPAYPKVKEMDNNYRPIVPIDVSEPNATTLEALEELERGEGVIFFGTTKRLLQELERGP